MFKFFKSLFENEESKRSIQVANQTVENQTNNKLLKTNILKSENGTHSNMAYFDDGVVYCYLQNIDKEIVIGRYTSDGIVSDGDGYQIGKISDGIIMLNRLGDMQRVRESLFGKSDERSLTQEEGEVYYPMARRVTLCWNCAESSDYGAITDFKTYQKIAEPINSYDPESQSVNRVAHQKWLQEWQNDTYSLGFGACFVCLAYLNGTSTKYGSFYCPTDETFIEP